MERARRGLSNDPQVCVDIHSPSRVMISLKRMVRWPFGTMEIKHGTMGGTIGTIVPQKKHVRSQLCPHGAVFDDLGAD